MSERTKKYFPVLKRIRQLGEKGKKEYVRKCDSEFINCVSECAKNVIKGNVPLTDRQMTRLRRERNNLRALSVKKTSLKKRRILQKGGFLTALTVRSGRSTYRIMQAAKKLVLIDEFDREYKILQKPAEAVAKTNKSLTRFAISLSPTIVK